MKFLALMHALSAQRQSQPLAPSQLTACWRRVVEPHVIRLKTTRSYAVDPDTVVVGGTYDQEDEKLGLPCIEISLVYHPEQETIQLDDTHWTRACLDLAECIGHEQIHQEQAHRRGWRSRAYCSQAQDRRLREEQQYLGAGCEIDAYGFSIAAELCYLHGVFEPADSTLEQVFMYRVYRDTFAEDQSVLLELRKCISKYLCRLEVDYHDKTDPRVIRPRTRRSKRRPGK
jgi:hypothetical protein